METTYTFRNKDGSEMDLSPETKKKAVRMMFEQEYCIIEVAVIDKRYTREEANKLQAGLYDKYGLTNPKHRRRL